MSYIAQRMACIDASGIRKVFALASKMVNPINLSIGQPDYDVDQPVKEVAIRAIQAGFNTYTETWGIKELRDECSAYYERRFGVPLHNVMITGGVSGGLFLGLLATVNPGDEVICGDPYFVMYKHLVTLLGGVSIPVDTYPDFKLKAANVEAAITPKTKILIVNSPANPTGVTLSREELAALADVARRHNLLVIADEIYEQLAYDSAPVTMAGMYDNVLLLNGFSKMAGMPGWRIGFAAGPEEIVQQMNTLQQYSFVCAPSFAQKAAVEALRLDHTPKTDAYRRKRDIVYNGLKKKFNVTKPGGAFYIFPEAPGGDGDEFVTKAIENNVLIIPGSVFSQRKTNFRISFAAPDDTLKRGVEILNRLANQL
ncbi:MAG: aminotransferase class I/II-fold pyridoxal phosphate-dependent enzyme [Candidatus Hydrogenedentes bacterium]|nr:aminotransferase class I/II-fold pyridoxal phosphate-dependent enzyme [Candidatus Hydrogenedentota bacterium]